MSDPPDLADYVAVEIAGKLAGISSRTLRHWVRTGKLSAIAGKRGKLVSLAEVRHLAVLIGKEVGKGEAAPGEAAMSADEVASKVAGPVAETAVVTDTTRRQLATIRDEWLVPLVERLGALERENGRLVAEREAQAETIAELRARLEHRTAGERAVESAPAPPGAPTAGELPTDAPAPAAGLWQRFRAALGR